MDVSPGTYTLVVELARDGTVTFGASGDRDLDAGFYGYTGSAFGPGGLARADRHRELAAGQRDATHWHVDYLLTHPATTLVTAVTTKNEDRECAVARELVAACTPITGLGASDCDCATHLVHHENRERLERAVRHAHA